LHPLRDSTWIEIFPILSLFDVKVQGLGQPTISQTRAYQFMQNEAVEMGNTKPSQVFSQLIEFNDPQKALGAGISSYHQQLVQMGAIMTILLILHIPALTIYGGYGFYDSALSSLTLGNMGFTESHCVTDSVADTNL
jgi:hypothetical protein